MHTYVHVGMYVSHVHNKILNPNPRKAPCALPGGGPGQEPVQIARAGIVACEVVGRVLEFATLLD